MDMSSARALYSESKAKLCERIHLNVNSFGSIASTLGQGGKAQEALKQSTDRFVSTEHQINDSAENLRKLQLLHIHMNYQFENIEKNVTLIENLKEQAQAMRR